MKIFIDEDTGTRVAKALYELKVASVEYVSNSRVIKKGTIDEQWIPFVGRGGYLLISCNTGILESEAQRNLLINERVGAVFLTSGQITALELMRLLLNKWEWLELIDSTEPRPFAFTMSPKGRTKQIRL